MCVGVSVPGHVWVSFRLSGDLWVVGVSFRGNIKTIQIVITVIIVLMMFLSILA